MVDYRKSIISLGSVLDELLESLPWRFMFVENRWVQAESGRVQLDISENNWFRMVSDQIRASTVWVKNAGRKERGEERNERKATWKAVWTASGIVLSHYFHSKLHSPLFSLEVAFYPKPACFEVGFDGNRVGTWRSSLTFNCEVLRRAIDLPKTRPPFEPLFFVN